MTNSIEDYRRSKRSLSRRMGLASAAPSSRQRGVRGTTPLRSELGHAIAIAPKVTGGKVLRELAVQVYVIRKRPKFQLGRGEKIPATIAGIPTDVVEMPRAHALAGKAKLGFQPPAMVLNAQLDLDIDTLRRRNRPLVPGTSVGHRSVSAGTIGALCRSLAPDDDGDAVYLLSNTHVLADLAGPEIGGHIYQPARDDGATLDHKVARLSRFAFPGMGDADPFTVDAAIAKLRDASNLVGTGGPRNDFGPMGVLRGITTAKPGMRVWKIGRETGLTRGEVVSVDHDHAVTYDHGEVAFDDQISIKGSIETPVFSDNGDSGSLVVEDGTNRAIGLLFAGTPLGFASYAHPIARVLDQLTISLVSA